MAILHGYINLSRIDKNLITTTTYDARTKKKAYLANFKPKDLNSGASPATQQNDDLGF